MLHPSAPLEGPEIKPGSDRNIILMVVYLDGTDHYCRPADICPEQHRTMIVRIVKMTFEPEHVARFQELFEGWKPRIRAFQGCRYLELLHDVDDPRIFFTYSHWDGPTDLEAYRLSEVFASVWPVVKSLFATPAEAWSTEREQQLP